MHKERLVIEDRRAHATDAAGAGDDSHRRERPSEPAHDRDGVGGLSEGMRSYILGYGGPITADCANPLKAAS